MLSGGLSDQVVTLEQLQLTREAGAAGLAMAGRANLAGSTPRFELQGDWRTLAWPLAGDPQIVSESGRFSVDGSADDYRVDLKTALDVPGQTGGELSLSGRGGSEAFELADLRLSLLDGYLQGRGKVQWSPQLRGAVTLQGEGLDPAVLAPGFPGDLRITLRAEGGITDGAASAEIDTLSLGGSLRDQPLAVQLRGSVQGAQLDLGTFTVHSGQTRISAQGRVGDRTELQWDIDSPDLGELLPGAEGSLSGRGSLTGSMALPAVRGDLQADAIAYRDYRLEHLALELDVDLGREAPSRLDFTLEEADLAGTEISSLGVTGAGNRHDHQLTLELDSPQGEANLTLAGDLGDSLWRGELTAGELRYAELAPWTLADPQGVYVGLQEQELERGCWRSADSRLCLQAKRADGELAAALGLDAFALTYLRPILPRTLLSLGHPRRRGQPSPAGRGGAGA